MSGADELEIVPSLSLPVASIGHLIAMKLLARDDRQRPADADDLVALARVATDTDWLVASSAVDLIHRRGFGRGRDLIHAMLDLRTQDPG